MIYRDKMGGSGLLTSVYCCGYPFFICRSSQCGFLRRIIFLLQVDWSEHEEGTFPMLKLRARQMHSSFPCRYEWQQKA